MTNNNNEKTIKVSAATLKLLKRIAADNEEKLYQTIDRLCKTELAKPTGKRK